MASNPFIIEQAAVVFTGGAMGLVIAWTMLQAFVLRRDLLAAFRLKKLGLAAMAWSAVMMLVLIQTLWGYGDAFGSAFAFVAWAIPPVVLLLGGLARSRYRRGCERALDLAEAASDFDRPEVYRSYIEAFPGEEAPLTRLIQDNAGLRVASALDRKGLRFAGAPLLVAVADRLEAQGDRDAIEKAVGLGYFEHRPALQERLIGLARDNNIEGREAILERRPGAPRVGQALRRLLEDAVVYPELVLDLDLDKWERLDAAGRLAVQVFEQELSGHLQRVHVPLRRERQWYSAGDSAPAPLRRAAGGPPVWSLRLAVVSCTPRAYTWTEERLEQPLSRYSHQRNASFHMSQALPSAVSKKIEKSSVFPEIKARVSLVRDGVEIGAVDVDSSHADTDDLNGGVRKSTIQPPRQSALMLIEQLLKGLGLGILAREKPASGASRGLPVDPRAATEHARTQTDNPEPEPQHVFLDEVVGAKVEHK